MGSVHLIVRDIDAERDFFKLLGGVPVVNGTLQMMEFPGMFVILEKGEPSGGSIGSIVNHFGFQVKDMKEWLPKWQAASLKIEPMNRPTQLYMRTPDDVRVEVLEEHFAGYARCGASYSLLHAGYSRGCRRGM